MGPIKALQIAKQNNLPSISFWWIMEYIDVSRAEDFSTAILSVTEAKGSLPYPKGEGEGEALQKQRGR